MRRRIDIQGEQFGNITVLENAGVDNGGNSLWKCKCTCGREIIRSYSNIVRSAGVGCKECKNEYLRKTHYKHGDTDTRLHNIWLHMRHRCQSTTDADYKNYGERGIAVCDEWQEYQAFKEWALSNGYADDLTIERVNVDDGYNPSNCKWIPKGEQTNNRRNTKYFTINGTRKTLSDWCKEYGQNGELVRARLKYGFDIKDALERSVRQWN